MNKEALKRLEDLSKLDYVSPDEEVRHEIMAGYESPNILLHPSHVFVEQTFTDFNAKNFPPFTLFWKCTIETAENFGPQHIIDSNIKLLSPRALLTDGWGLVSGIIVVQGNSIDMGALEQQDIDNITRSKEFELFGGKSRPFEGIEYAR